MDDTPPPSRQPPRQSPREERLRSRLRDNLRRRKAQARLRAQEPPAAASDGAEPLPVAAEDRRED